MTVVVDGVNATLPTIYATGAASPSDRRAQLRWAASTFTRRVAPSARAPTEGGTGDGNRGPGGADVQIVRPDDVTELTARYAIRTPTGTTVFVENHGPRHAPPEVNERLLRGEAVDPALVYFRCEPRFETDDPGLAWMERQLFIGVGARFPDLVRIDVYQVR